MSEGKRGGGLRRPGPHCLWHADAAEGFADAGGDVAFAEGLGCCLFSVLIVPYRIKRSEGKSGGNRPKTRYFVSIIGVY